MADQVYEGLPTLSLLPLNNTQFKVVGSSKITLPREGNYHELQPKVFEEAHGDFKLLDKDILYLPSITKILLATNNYPKLEGNQLYAPHSIAFEKDSVIIIGSVLEILKVEQKSNDDN
jgi:hypothetical protein